MTVNPSPGTPQGEPPLGPKPPLITSEGLLYLTLGGLATAITIVNPSIGVAIGVGLAVIGLLIKLSS